MISISKKTIKKLTKIGLVALLGYTAYFTLAKASRHYKNYNEKNDLMQKITIKKNKINALKKQKTELEENKKRLKAQYITKAQLAKKVKDIFKRMSLLDYNLKYIDSKQLCLDRYIIVAQLVAQSANGKKAGEGILSYLGETKKSKKNDTIYFVDYITKAKVKK